MNSFVRLGFIPPGYDLGLLVLRVCFGFSLFWCHGLPKITGFSRMVEHFPDPLHLGMRTTLLLVIFAESVGVLLVIIGFGTRWAALIIAIDVGSAFVFVHKFHLTGPGSSEPAFLHLVVILVLFITGAGKYSLDRK